MAILRDPDRFALPVAAFIRQRLKEEFPNYPSGQGSAFGDVLILPAAFILQQFRDELNVMKRNMSILNFQTMLEEEMDRLASNFLVQRRKGVRCYGTVRVFFDQLQPVSIDQKAIFFDDENHRWAPISSVVMTLAQLELNAVADTGEYYADVPVIADAVGPDFQADVDQVNQLAGILGATRCTNLTKFSEGKADDTNTDLYIAVKDSVTNNELVKAQAIRKALRENFQSVRSVQVVGFGHPAMQRDVVSAVVSLQKMIPYSYTQKYNLPLDSDGNVNFYDAFGNIVISPIGGVVAAVRDLTALDYNSLDVTLDGQSRQIVSVQPGFRVRMYPAVGVPVDPDEGDYTVTRVEEVPVEPGGVPVKVLRLDRPFRDPNLSAFDPVADAQKYKYTILGPVATNRFHVGGKIDVYVDSTASEEETVIVASLQETATGSGVAEVPILETVPYDPVTGTPMFENNKAFILPYLGALKVEQIAADNDQSIERELIAGENYVYISAASRERFTTTENDVIRIMGNDENGNPLFIGKRIKITYLTNRDIPLMQSYVDDPQNKNEGTDTKVYATKQVFIDVRLQYKGTLDLGQVETILKKFIQSKGAGATLTTQEISLVLGVVGVTDIVHPITISSFIQEDTGQTSFSSSEDRISLEDYQSFYPVDELSVERLS